MVAGTGHHKRLDCIAGAATGHRFSIGSLVFRRKLLAGTFPLALVLWLILLCQLQLIFFMFCAGRKEEKTPESSTLQLMQ